MLLSDTDSRWHDRLSLFLSTSLLHRDNLLAGDFGVRNEENNTFPFTLGKAGYGM